jgi:hypothetical protein
VKLRIISEGTGSTTRVETADGKRIDNVTSIELKPILPGKSLTAIITVTMVALDLTVEEARAKIHALMSGYAVDFELTEKAIEF